MKTRKIASFIVTGILTGCLFAIAGCGGPSLSGTDNKLTGQWVAEKLNAKGDRILLVFNETSVATTPTDTTPNNPYDKPSKTDPHSIRIMAIRSAGDSLNVDAGSYSVDKNKINFNLTTMSDFASPFTITEPTSSAPGQLTLGTDLYYKVTGDLNGPQLGGQIQISQTAPDEGVAVSSVRTSSVGGGRPGDEVPGEILVKYKDEGEAGGESGASSGSSSGSTGGGAALTVSSASVRFSKTLSNSFVGNVLHKAYYDKIQILHSSALFGGVSSLSVSTASSEPKTLSAMSFSSLETHDQNFAQLSEDTHKAIAELMKDPNVVYAVPNRILTDQSLSAPTDAFYDQQWNLRAINAPDAWGVAASNKKVTVAVIDTGIVDHPDLAGQVDKADGYDFVHDSLSVVGDPHPITDLDLDGTPGPDSDPTDPGDQESDLGEPGGSSWHGTHLAGIIAGLIDNGTGIAGIAKDVQILPVRVIGYQGKGTLDDVAQGIYYAAKLKNIADCATGTPVNDGVAAGTYSIDKTSAAWTNCDAVIAGKTRPKADIINLSLGALLDPQSATPLNDAVNAAAGAGVMVVAASGNDASGPTKCLNASAQSVDCFFYPASNPNVLSIGAVYPNLAFANAYSNFGGDGSANSQFLVAPGGSGAGAVLSTVNPSVNGGYFGLQGTSQAAAHVSGVAALVMSDQPGLTIAQVKQALQQSAIDLGDPGLDKYYGYGLVNACGAVLKGREIAGAPTTLAGTLKLSATTVDFGPVGTTSTVVITGGCGTVSGIQARYPDHASAPWLTPVLTTGTTPSQLTFTVNRAGLAAGDYTKTVEVYSTTDSAQTPVDITIKMTVGAASTSTGSAVDNLRKEIEGFLAGGGSGYTNDSDVGEMIVMLIDANTGQAAYYTKTDFTANYNFQFGGLNPGSYYILAGVDTNQDGTICKDGETEPCIAYPTFAQPQPVDVTATTKQNDLVLTY